jgi:hypothetical protein
MIKRKRLYQEVILCAGFFVLGEFPENATDYLIEYDVFKSVISSFYRLRHDRISREIVRMGAKVAGVKIRNTGNKYVFRVPVPQNPKVFSLFQEYFDRESGVL